VINIVERPIKVLLAKPGLDGHNRGAHVINRALVDAGMEVIYLGLRKEPFEIAAAALEEDVDLVGLSILSGAHMELVPALMNQLAELGAADIPIVVGGVIPDDDAEELKGRGVAEVFHPGDPLSYIVERVRAAAGRAPVAAGGD
jgi:methylmalonyl-CoA mutase C-terminal domain/subunit